MPVFNGTLHCCYNSHLHLLATLPEILSQPNATSHSCASLHKHRAATCAWLLLCYCSSSLLLNAFLAATATSLPADPPPSEGLRVPIWMPPKDNMPAAAYFEYTAAKCCMTVAHEQKVTLAAKLLHIAHCKGVQQTFPLHQRWQGSGEGGVGTCAQPLVPICWRH